MLPKIALANSPKNQSAVVRVSDSLGVLGCSEWKALPQRRVRVDWDFRYTRGTSHWHASSMLMVSGSALLQQRRAAPVMTDRTAAVERQRLSGLTFGKVINLGKVGRVGGEIPQ